MSYVERGLGIEIRLRRLLGSGRPFVLAMDDGVYEAPRGVFRRPERFRHSILSCVDCPSTFLATVGIAQRFLPADIPGERIITLSMSPAHEIAAKRKVHSVRSAIACGADGVAAHISTACQWEGETVAAASHIVERAHSVGFPVLLASYARCEEADVNDRVRAVRMAVELGADMVKTDYPGEAEVLGELVDASADVPLLIAGGAPSSNWDTMAIIDQVCTFPPTVGVCFGRRVIYADDPQYVMGYIRRAFQLERGCGEPS